MITEIGIEVFEETERCLEMRKKMNKLLELSEGFFYMNNVKYIKSAASEGAATKPKPRVSPKGFIGRLVGLTVKSLKDDFDEPREWIFAHETPSPTTSIDSSPKNTPQGQSEKCSPGSYVSSMEESTRFRSTSEHSPGIFHTLRICLLEIPDDRKPRLKKLIELHGGKVMLDLVKNKVDILLACNNGNIKNCSSSVQNLQLAKSWGVARVDVNWVEESVRVGTLIPFDKFQVKEDKSPLIPGSRDKQRKQAVNPELRRNSCSFTLESLDGNSTETETALSRGDINLRKSMPSLFTPSPSYVKILKGRVKGKKLTYLHASASDNGLCTFVSTRL